MSFSDDLDQTLAYGRKTMHTIKHRNSPASPPYYDLWYNYVSGYNRALVQDVNNALESDGSLSMESFQTIYDKHFSLTITRDQVSDLGQQIGGELEEILGVVAASVDDTSQYGMSLANVSSDLKNNPSDEIIKALVDKLVSSTFRMEKSNMVLQRQLEESSDQINRLSHNLEAIKTESLTDKLTNIANRKHFDEALENMLIDAGEHATECCLLLGDIDFFKNFNDTYGHQTGDQVLRLVAQVMSANVKGKDLAARYGGEEFGILLPDTNLGSASVVANAIREAIKSKELVKKSTGENLGAVTMSFGVARYRPGDSPEDIIRRADICLYAAKEAGRDQVKCETDPGIEFEQESVA